MKFNLSELFKTLRLPLGLVGVIVALLAWMGFTLEQVTAVAVSLVGLQLLQSFVIDVLKYGGVVNEGSSGKWSAVFNLITLFGVVVWLKFFPQIDVYALDNQLLELAKVCIYVFAYVTQIVGTKRVHDASVSAGVGYSFKPF